MKSNTIQFVTGILQIVWSLPVIGVFFVTNLAYPIMMIVVHGVTIAFVAQDGNKKAGNIMGLFACLLALIAANDIRTFSGLGSTLFLLISWPFHIISAVMIFVNYSKNKKNQSQQITSK